MYKPHVKLLALLTIISAAPSLYAMAPEPVEDPKLVLLSNTNDALPLTQPHESYLYVGDQTDSQKNILPLAVQAHFERVSFPQKGCTVHYLSSTERCGCLDEKDTAETLTKVVFNQVTPSIVIAFLGKRGRLLVGDGDQEEELLPFIQKASALLVSKHEDSLAASFYIAEALLGQRKPTGTLEFDLGFFAAGDGLSYSNPPQNQIESCQPTS